MSKVQAKQVPQWPVALGSSDALGKCISAVDLILESPIGKGAFAVVRKARYVKNLSTVAVKQYLLNEDDCQHGIPRPILREISILRTMKHPNIVKALDVALGPRVGDLYLVLEYVDFDLAKLMDDTDLRFDLGQAKCLFKQVLEALKYIHSNGIAHRDIKTGNLLLDASGTLKLVDFGTARKLSEQSSMTPSVTTIWYAAPEQLLSSLKYSQAVDMWSAGLLLAELLLSEPLLQGEDPFDQLLLAVKNIGSPSNDDFRALQSIGCSDLRFETHLDRSPKVAGTLDKKFRILDKSKDGTVAYLSGLLRWNPKTRLSAKEALGQAQVAREWWTAEPALCNRLVLADLVRSHVKI